MQRPILISLSPNAEADDVELAWKTLFSPKLWNDDSLVTQCETTLSKTFDSRSVTMTSSGRSALYTLLQAYGIGSGDEVIIQAFTCIAVPEPILWVGATPIYADIDPTTYNLDSLNVEQKITSKTKAIIVQHTFGIPGPLTPLKELCRKHNLLLIEDLAHGFGGTYNNQVLGTFGDAAFLSFGRDKLLSSVFGGAIVTNDPIITERVRKNQQLLPHPPRWWVMQQLFHPISMHTIVPLYFQKNLGKVALVMLQKAGFLSKAVTPEERLSKKPRFIHWRFSPALAVLLLLQLTKMKRYTQRRRTIADRYMKALSGSHIKLPSIDASFQPAWLRFPCEVSSPNELRRAALAEGMMLGDWYDAPLVPGNADFAAFQYTQGMCPRAEAAAAHIINLPTYPLLSDTDIATVIAFMQRHP